MRVSIITPSYNQAPFLEQTIQSVLNQDYEDLEYIIVDGASTDGSPEIIRRYADRLAWWVSEPDNGQADAIRKGFARAQGEIIGWLNSDDLLVPGVVQEAVSVFEANPEVVLVYGNAASIGPGGSLLNDMVFRQFGMEDLATFNIICQPAVFMRKDAYDAVGGIDLAYHFLLDHHLWLRIAGYGKIRHVPLMWAFARQHPDAKNVAAAGAFGTEAHRIVAWMKSHSAYAEFIKNNRRKVYAAALRFDARYMLDGGWSRKSFITYLRALITHPPTALKEWQRIIFAGLSTIGLRNLGKLYYRRKHKRGSVLLPGVRNVSELYE